MATCSVEDTLRDIEAFEEEKTTRPKAHGVRSSVNVNGDSVTPPKENESLVSLLNEENVTTGLEMA